MKKGLFLLSAILLLPLAATAQNNDIDALFNRYSSIDGATYLNLSGPLIDFFLSRSGENKLTEMASTISEIRVLTFKRDADPDFYRTVTSGLALSLYTELVHIRDAGEQFLLLADMDEESISELLMVVGGDENVLIRVKGSLSLSSVDGLSGSSSMNLLQDFGFRR